MSNFSQNQPVFLMSSVRSGSTLLRLMLDSHPNIANPGECDFLFDKIADDGTPPDIQRYLEWLEINRIFLGKNLNVDTSMNYSNLIYSFVNQMKQPESVLVMNIHRHFYRIPKIFPLAKYIYLVRDGRDVARSCIGMGWVGNVYYGIDIWRDAEIAWDRLKVTLQPTQYLEIKYEDLLENIDLGLGQICQFLGFAYSNAMMDYATTTTYSLPDKSLCYQWRSKYSKRELSLVESKAGKLLINRGYQLSGAPIYENSVFDAINLFIQNKLFRIKYQIAAYGFVFFILYYLARRFGISSLKKLLEKRKNVVDIKMLK